jgi:DNA-binding response OmpR family regulator
VRILVVEENKRLSLALTGGLRAQGYGVDSCASDEAVGERPAGEPYDLVLLDPELRGAETCRNLRSSGVTAPILIVSEVNGLAEKVAGLDAGADDYLTQPFEEAELHARIRALLRRARSNETSRLTYAELEVDLIRRVARRQGKRIPLSAREVAVLEFLIRNAERVLTRPVIAQGVWDMDYEPSSNVIDVYISNLRKKIDRGFEEPLIHTVVGTGYVFGKRRKDG